ncbi:MAG: type VII toxin-antitoxin system HepT family RNase toxin [Nitrospirota bacterium]
MNDIVINKIQSIQRCVERAREEYQSNPAGFDTDYTRQDAALLNILRACELSIDLANHLIRIHKMGIPLESAESFDLLQRKAVIDKGLAEKMKNMVGFRNKVIHEYKRVKIEIVIDVIKTGLDDLLAFTDTIMEFVRGHSS